MKELLSRPKIKIVMSAFSKRVLKLIKKVPRGKVATYGQIARLAGKPQGSRGVGWILHSCAKSHKLPWQRIINSQGKISFPRDTFEFAHQKRLLEKEDVEVSDGGLVSLETFGW
jgi:methylated-DNA-protein-cysteine methyltransferase-like protein